MYKRYLLNYRDENLTYAPLHGNLGWPPPADKGYLPWYDMEKRRNSWNPRD